MSCYASVVPSMYKSTITEFAVGFAIIYIEVELLIEQFAVNPFIFIKMYILFIMKKSYLHFIFEVKYNQYYQVTTITLFK